MNISKVQMW